MEEMVRDANGFISLKRTYSELYKKVSYTADVDYVVDRIYEYDIRSANTSALRESGLIDESILTMLEGLDKQSREETIGKMIRREKMKKKDTIYKAISNGILKAKEKLLNSNYAIQQIANITGYTDAFTFSKAFKRYTGLSPKYYREKH